MNPKLKRYGLAAAAAFFFASPLAHAVMFKWTDESGSVTYSNTPPPDQSKVSNFIAIEDSTVPADKRPKQSEAAPPATAKPEVPAPKGDTPALATDRTEGTRDSARTVTRSSRPEAVRDPCLRSSDPLCHQRHKDKYHPYLGYAPSVTTGAGSAASAPPAPVGATSSAGAGGTVGAQIRMTPTPALATGSAKAR